MVPRSGRLGAGALLVCHLAVLAPTAFAQDTGPEERAGRDGVPREEAAVGRFPFKVFILEPGNEATELTGSLYLRRQDRFPPEVAWRYLAEVELDPRLPTGSAVRSDPTNPSIGTITGDLWVQLSYTEDGQPMRSVAKVSEVRLVRRPRKQQTGSTAWYIDLREARRLARAAGVKEELPAELPRGEREARGEPLPPAEPAEPASREPRAAGEGGHRGWVWAASLSVVAVLLLGALLLWCRKPSPAESR